MDSQTTNISDGKINPINASIPDVRFAESFNKSLSEEAEKQRTLRLKEQGVNDAAILELQKKEPAEVTKYIVWKVILKDIIVMPLVQGIMYTSILIVIRPWLSGVITNGRKFGTFIYNTVLGKNLTKGKTQ